MAGSVVGPTADIANNLGTKLRMGQRLTRAYSDGRNIYPDSTNPHTASTPENTAWQLGYDNRADSGYAYETAVA